MSNHRYLGTVGAEIGYVGRCACGWASAEKPKRRAAQGAVAAHIGQAGQTGRTGTRPGTRRTEVGA